MSLRKFFPILTTPLRVGDFIKVCFEVPDQHGFTGEHTWAYIKKISTNMQVYLCVLNNDLEHLTFRAGHKFTVKRDEVEQVMGRGSQKTELHNEVKRITIVQGDE